jgi:molybdenum cofactor guanylyltransferase
VRLAGLLLTGGASRRLGVPKALLTCDGERLVDRSARTLSAVCAPVLEVGPGYGALPACREREPGAGPLAGFVAGAFALHADGYDGPLIVLAVDLPSVTPELLQWLAEHEGTGCVVPRVAGQLQTVCARYSPDACRVAPELYERGERSMRALLDAVAVTEVDEDEWSAVGDMAVFADVDTPDDAARAGLEMPG